MTTYPKEIYDALEGYLKDVGVLNRDTGKHGSNDDAYADLIQRAVLEKIDQALRKSFAK